MDEDTWAPDERVEINSAGLRAAYDEVNRRRRLALEQGRACHAAADLLLQQQVELYHLLPKRERP